MKSKDRSLRFGQFVQRRKKSLKIVELIRFPFKTTLKIHGVIKLWILHGVAELNLQPLLLDCNVGS